MQRNNRKLLCSDDSLLLHCKVEDCCNVMPGHWEAKIWLLQSSLEGKPQVPPFWQSELTTRKAATGASSWSGCFFTLLKWKNSLLA